MAPGGHPRGEVALTRPHYDTADCLVSALPAVLLVAAAMLFRRTDCTANTGDNEPASHGSGPAERIAGRHPSRRMSCRWHRTCFSLSFSPTRSLMALWRPRKRIERTRMVKPDHLDLVTQIIAIESSAGRQHDAVVPLNSNSSARRTGRGWSCLGGPHIDELQEMGPQCQGTSRGANQGQRDNALRGQ